MHSSIFSAILTIRIISNSLSRCFSFTYKETTLLRWHQIQRFTSPELIIGLHTYMAAVCAWFWYLHFHVFIVIYEMSKILNTITRKESSWLSLFFSKIFLLFKVSWPQIFCYNLVLFFPPYTILWNWFPFIETMISFYRNH